MSRKIPKFLLYGEGNPEIEERIQPRLPIRNWGALEREEKEEIFFYLSKNFFIDYDNIIQTIEYLNHHFMRISPGGELRNYTESINDSPAAAAERDFENIFMYESEDWVLLMLSKFAKNLINEQYYNLAVKENDEGKQQEYIAQAYETFDTFAKILNHIFEQFVVNQMLTRNGFVPRQDDRITEDVYVPTIQILANPQWKDVSNDLARMFEDYREKKYAEAITKAHSTVQRFLQILVGTKGKNGKGEVGKLFSEAKARGLISENAEPFVTAIQKTIARALNLDKKQMIFEHPHYAQKICRGISTNNLLSDLLFEKFFDIGWQGYVVLLLKRCYASKIVMELLGKIYVLLFGGV